jgi:hypothetical protein
VFDQILCDLVFGAIGDGQDEFFVVLVFADDLEQTSGATIGRKEDFAFAVEDELLQVKGDRFCDTEVLHFLRYLDLQLFTDPEKMVDRVAAGENDGGVFGNFYFLFPEFLSAEPFETELTFFSLISATFFCVFTAFAIFKDYGNIFTITDPATEVSASSSNNLMKSAVNLSETESFKY